MSQQPGTTAAGPSYQTTELRSVVVKDLDMPFWSMCRFMVKWSIAAIPAAIILLVVLTLFLALFGTAFRGLLH